MGVLLTTGAIVAAVAIGVWSEGRWPQGAAGASRSALTLLLYVLLPPVIFFNIAASEIDVGHGVGLVLGIVSRRRVSRDGIQAAVQSALARAWTLYALTAVLTLSFVGLTIGTGLALWVDRSLLGEIESWSRPSSATASG